MSNGYYGGLSIRASSATKRLAILAAGIAGVIALLLAPLAVLAAPNNANKGFDNYGYNDNARVFVGDCLSWYIGKYGGTEENAIQQYCGDYANDRLVMKWNKAWDDCNAAGNDDEAACAGAWLTNQWNGNVPGGTGETWQYKQIWVGSEGEDSEYWREGGELLWGGNYEMITSRGNVDGQRDVQIHTKPNGLGN